jgi:hypothetical protein
MRHDAWFAVLKAASLALIGFGLLTVASTFEAFPTPWLLFMQLVTSLGGPVVTELSADARLVSAILGGMMTAWGVILTALAFGPIPRGDADARRLYFLSVTTWAVLDSAASVAGGWPGNALLNIPFYLLYAVPLIAIDRRAKRGAAVA